MTVEFRVEKLFNQVSVNTQIKQYYEDIIGKTVTAHFNNDLKINKIIVPNDFISEVLALQVFLGMDNPSVTNNEFGRAFGKMIHDKSKDEYYIFIDPCLASFLIDDNILSECFCNLGNEFEKEASTYRQQALNVLCHELAHVEFHCQIECPVVTSTLKSQIDSLIYQLFDEYYACRKSLLVSSTPAFLYDDEYIYNIEKRILEKKWEYKTHYINLDDFCEIFHTLTRQILVGLAASLGLQQMHSLKRYGIEYLLEPVINDFDMEFKKLYEQALIGERVLAPNRLSRCINTYFNLLGVNISQEPEGIYYSIPN